MTSEQSRHGSLRHVFGASGLYLTVTATETAVNLVAVPLLTRFLTPADYSVLLIIANVAGILNLLFGFSLAQAMPSIFAAAAEPEKRRSIATTILLSIATLSLLVYGLATAIAVSAYPSSSRLLILAAMGCYLAGTGMCFASLARLVELPRLVAAVQVSTSTVHLVLLLAFLVGLGLGFPSVYIAMTGAGACAIAAYGLGLRGWLQGRFDLAVLAEAARTGLRLWPSQIATLLTTGSAGLVLARFGHFNEAGLFAVAASASIVLVNVSNSFVNAWSPFVLLRHKSEDLQSRQRLAFGYYSSVLLMASSGLSIFAEEVFALLVGEEFRPAFNYVPPLVLAYTLFNFANAFSQGIQAKQRMTLYAWFGAAVSVVFMVACLLLVGRYGVYGLIAAMAAAFLTMLVAMQAASERLLPVGYPWARHAVMWGIAAVAVGATYDLGIAWRMFGLKLIVLTLIALLPFAFGVLRLSEIRGLLKAWS
ncbi:MAG: lipopolysaccharide biosynthesis protein [Hyphomicrobiaceae bacterium]|nr:MAG: lipopolysaccharide biosynthesis protein [Hyphomicrobiaceae bacterium]